MDNNVLNICNKLSQESLKIIEESNDWKIISKELTNSEMATSVKFNRYDNVMPTVGGQSDIRSLSDKKLIAEIELYKVYLFKDNYSLVNNASTLLIHFVLSRDDFNANNIKNLDFKNKNYIVTRISSASNGTGIGRINDDIEFTNLRTNLFLGDILHFIYSEKNRILIVLAERGKAYYNLILPKLKQIFNNVNNLTSNTSIVDGSQLYNNASANLNKRKDAANNELMFNRLIYGAPGTGKSHRITEDIRTKIIDYTQTDYNGKDVFRTTLHPEYSYYDFVGSIKPIVKKEDGKEIITYEFTQGIFTKALIQAFKNYYENGKKPVFLVLEEMSRANVTAVFGDIFQLLDRNDKEEPGRSEYRIKNDDILNALRYAFKDKDNNDTNEYIKKMTEIYIPSNLYIWGTVNTSDQNVYVIDNAFKRRFNPEYESINAVKYENGNYKNNYELLYAFNNKRVSWVQFYQNLDEYIVTDLNLPEDKQLGQFYIQFRNPNEPNNWDDDQINHKLILYLWNDLKGASIRNKVDIFHEDIKSYGQAFETYSKLLKGDDVKVFSDTFIKNVIENDNTTKEQEN